MNKEINNETFYDLVVPIMKYLRINGNPYQTIVITQAHADLLQTEMGVPYKQDCRKDGEDTCQK